MSLTIHGGPRFTEWQRRKTQPNLNREIRNFNGDLVYFVSPVIVDLCDAIAKYIETVAPFAEALIELGVIEEATT